MDLGIRQRNTNFQIFVFMEDQSAMLLKVDIHSGRFKRAHKVREQFRTSDGQRKQRRWRLGIARRQHASGGVGRATSRLRGIEDGDVKSLTPQFKSDRKADDARASDDDID